MFSCITEKDQYPELPLFDLNLYSDNLIIEELNFKEKFVTDTDNYIYTIFRKGYDDCFDGVSREIIIRDKLDYKIIHKSNIGKLFSIATTGSVYFLENDICYKLEPPFFDKTIINSISLEDLHINKIKKDNRDEMIRLNLKYNTERELNEKYWDYIKKKRNEVIEEKILKNYKLLYYDLHINLIEYKDGSEFYIKERSFLEDRLDDYPRELKIISRNESRSKEKDFFSKVNHSIEEFDDSSLLVSEFDWSNNSGKFSSIIPNNYYSRTLYYYELRIGDKSFKCKSYSPLYKVISFNDDILIGGYGITYKIKQK